MVLYYSWAHDDLNNGGNVIRKRNLALLQKLAGEDEVVFYERNKQTTWLSRRGKSLQALTGCECGLDKELLRKIKESDLVFIDGTTEEGFSKRTLRKGKIVSFFHNVEYDYFCQETTTSMNIIKKMMHSFHKRAIFAYEKRLVRYSDTVITLNKRDSDRLKRLYKSYAQPWLMLTLRIFTAYTLSLPRSIGIFR